ncbi:MAG: preprotein translocase subunit SecE [Methylophilaceae bacterium]|nr:preprotein translocase subunit SecE [Methylophilaceae bacterium]
MTEKIKLVLSLLLLLAGVVGFYWLADQALVLRILAVIAGMMAASFVFWMSTLGKSSFAFAAESWLEARKVVWPSRKETIQTTLVVFALVLLVAAFLWVVDIGFLWMVKMLMGRDA